MSNLTTLFTDIADAIREKKGTTEKIVAETFPTEIKNLSVGGGEAVTVEGAKIFNSVEEMNDSTGNVEEDLAVVYGEALFDLEVGKSYTELYFPPTIVFEEAITATKYIYLNDTSTTSLNATQSLRITTSTIQFYKKGTLMGTAITDKVKYTSSDGITYTRTDSLGEVVTIAEIYSDAYTDIKVQEANIDLLNKIVKVVGTKYYGSYIYKNSAWEMITNNQDITITENGTYTAKEGYAGLGEVTVNIEGNINGSRKTTILAESDLASGDVCSLIEAQKGLETSRAYTLSGFTTPIKTPLLFKNISLVQWSDSNTDSYGVSGTSYAKTNFNTRTLLCSIAYDEVSKRYLASRGNYISLYTINSDGSTSTPYFYTGKDYLTPTIFGHKNNFTMHTYRTTSSTSDNTRFYKWDGSAFVDKGKIIGNTGLATGTSYLIDYILSDDDILYTCTLYNDTTAIIQKISLDVDGNYIGTSTYARIDNILTTGIDLFDHNISLGDVYSNVLFGKDANFIMWLDTNKLLHIADFDKTSLTVTERELYFDDETTNANTSRTINRFVLAGNVLFLELTVDGTTVVEAYIYNSSTGKFKFWCKPCDTFSPAVNAGQMVYPIRERDGSKIVMLNSSGGYTTYNLTEVVGEYEYYANNCSNTVSTDTRVGAYGIVDASIPTGAIGNVSVILKK